MIWPGILSNVALFVGFHEHNLNDRSSSHMMSRFQFFWIAFTLMFIWTLFPQFLMVSLQSFAPLCLLSNSRMIKFFASSENRYGVGIGALTLDWYSIGGAQLTTPWWATVNLTVSNVLFGWIVTPLVFYANAFGSDQKLSVFKYPDGAPIPILNSADLFNRTGHRISAVSLYDNTTFDLDENVYLRQAPIYITSQFAVTYATSFLSIMAAFVHVMLWHGKEIKQQMKAVWAQRDSHIDSRDIHNKLMRAYPDISESAFAAFLVLLIIFQVVTSSTTAFYMPIWAIFL
eukprot:jgi/Hompol1/3070/HPOL_006320-RA